MFQPGVYLLFLAKKIPVMGYFECFIVAVGVEPFPEVSLKLATGMVTLVLQQRAFL